MPTAPSDRLATKGGLLDRVPDFIFNASLETPYTPTSIVHLSRAKHILRKSELLEIPLELSSLQLELGMYTTTMLGAGEAAICLATLRAEAGGATESEAQELLDYIRLARFGSELILSTPVTNRVATMAKCALNVVTRSNCAVDVRGCFAQIEILKMTGPIAVSLAYGAATLLETTGDVDVQTGPEGRIVFAGCQGNATLRSAGAIDIKITDQVFQGSLEASTREMPIRILIPRGFRSSFEVIAPELICRADISPQVQRRQDNEQVVAHYGASEPNVLFHSSRGTVVIDNSTEE